MKGINQICMAMRLSAPAFAVLTASAAVLETPESPASRERLLASRLPEIFAKSAAHYRELDAAATPLMKDANGKYQLPHGWRAKDDVYDMRPYTGWTAGHYPGCLWLLYEATGDSFFRDRALAWMETIAPNSKVTDNHDVGFIMFCSYGNARRILKTDAYDGLLLETAESLCKRYNGKLGLIRSWGACDEKKDFRVIPDNMMNLELLEWAAKKSGNAKFDRIAVSHGLVTDRHHFRPDSSVFHVLDYDQDTGRVKACLRGQGAGIESAWSRGQAWAIYGYTMMFRETRRPEFLKRAVLCADYAVDSPAMPEDGVPFWDYGCPGEERDSSAGAIMASGLLELSGLAPVEKSAVYRAFAVKQLLSLSSPCYFAPPGANGHFLLMHGTGNKPRGSEIDVPLVYGDYYFLESLMRFKSTTNKGGQQ